VNPGGKFRPKLAQEKEKKTPTATTPPPLLLLLQQKKKEKKKRKQTNNKANATGIQRSFFVFPSFYLPSFELQQIADPWTKSQNF